MASANLQFKIGSTFSGEGFKQAQQAVGKVKQGFGPAVSAANQLSGAIGSLNTSVGKAGTAITSLLGSFAQGGVVGAAFSVAMIAVNKVVEEFTEKAKKAKEWIDSYNDALAGAKAREVNNTFKENIEYITSMRTDFERLATAANNYGAAILGLQQSQASGSVISLEIEKFQAMIDAENEAIQRDIEATYDLKIAKEKAKNVEEEGAVAVQLASEKVKQSAERIRIIREQLAEAEEVRKNLEIEMNSLSSKEKDGKNQRLAKIKEIEAKEDSIRAELQKAEDDKKVLLVKEQTAIQNAANANDKMKLAVEEAAQKIAETGTKWEACDPAAFIGGYQEELDKEFQKKVKDLVKEMPGKLNDLKQANANVELAVQNFQNAQNEANANFAQNEAVQALGGIFNGLNNNLMNPFNQFMQQIPGIANDAAKLAGDAALAAGQVKTLADLQKVEKEEAREKRIELYKLGQEVTRDKQEMERIKAKSEMARSQYEKDRLEALERVEAARNSQLRAVEDAKQKMIEAQQRRDKMQDDIAKIADKLKDGLDIDGVETALSNINTTITNLAIK